MGDPQALAMRSKSYIAERSAGNKGDIEYITRFLDHGGDDGGVERRFRE